MKSCSSTVLCLFALLVIAGCASTQVTSRDEVVTGQLPRPATIWVYDFAATQSDVPVESVLAGQYDDYDTPQTAGQIATGRELGSEIANDLIEEIRSMAMPAEHAWPDMRPQVNDIVIRGYLISIQKGETSERFFIGFGAGASELKVSVEGFQMTPNGLRKLGAGAVESESGKSPGTAVGLATLLATHNPAGLIISTGAHIYGEESGRSTVEGRAKQTAGEIGDALKKRFQQQGWID
jgi:hypothetical protein